MCNVNDRILDGVLTAAFSEYLDREFADLPSDEELKEMYPVSRKSLRKAQRRMKEIKYRKPLPLIYLQRAGVVFLTAATLCFGVLITRQEVDASRSVTVIKEFDDHIKFEFITPGSSGDETYTEEEIEKRKEKAIKHLADIEIGYFPDGYELEPSQSSESTGYRDYTYYNDKGEPLSIAISLPEGTCICVDNEHSELELTSINGNEAYINYNYEENIGTVIISNPDYVIDVCGQISRDELIKIAENIK